MKQTLALLLLLVICTALGGQEPFIDSFPMESGELELTRLAQPNTPFNKVGRRFAILGAESGSFEAWAYPLKLFRNFEFSFFIGRSTKPIPARDIVRYIKVAPAATTLTFCYQSFTIQAAYVTAIDEPAAMILLAIDSVEPLTVVSSFLPVLQPMWPAGIGGQSAYWNQELSAYQISEPTRTNTAYVGSPAASGISYTPAHMLSDTPSEFKIEISDPHLVKDKYIPIFMVGGKAPRDSVRALYQRTRHRARAIYERARSHYQHLLENTLAIHTPDQKLDRAFAWCKVSLDNLMVANPELGEGLIAGLGASGSSGRPGFGWFFGGDAYINSLAMCSYGALDATRTALSFTQKWQRQDGKMAHELSQAAGYIDWFKKYPYGYIHGDTTPFFIVAVGNYFRHSGDTAFVKQSWPALQKAFDWCILVDENRDGLIDNRKAGLGSVEYGALTDLSTDIYTGALSVAAFEKMELLAKVVRDKKYSAKALKARLDAEKSFDSKFWMKDSLTYANAFNDKGDQIGEVSPWISIPAVLDVGDSVHNRQSMYRLSRADMTTDWGIRSIANTSRYYGNLDYNYGAVWPFLSGFVATGQFNCGLVQQAFVNMKNIAALIFDNNLGSVMELYSGSHHIWPAEGVSQQGFSAAGIALAMSKGWLGLDVDAAEQKVTFAPALWPGHSEIKVENIKIGSAALNIQVSRAADRFTFTIIPINGQGVTLILAPRFGPACFIERIQAAQKECGYTLHQRAQVVQPVIPLQLSHDIVTVHIDTRSRWEWTPIPACSQIGDANYGLKIINLEKQGENGVIECHGRRGRSYNLGPQNVSRIISVTNGSMRQTGRDWHLDVSESGSADFIPVRIVFN